MTLRELIASDVTDVLMVADDFAEVITYYPAGGGSARSVYAIVEEAGTIRDDDHGLSSTETIHVTVSRDADDTATDGTQVNGIDDPQLGDSIRRANDLPDKQYSYTGDKNDVDDYSWSLVFVRQVMLKHGGKWQPRQ